MAPEERSGDASRRGRTKTGGAGRRAPGPAPNRLPNGRRARRAVTAVSPRHSPSRPGARRGAPCCVLSPAGMFVPCDCGGGSASPDFNGFTLLVVSRAPAAAPPSMGLRGRCPSPAPRSGLEGRAASWGLGAEGCFLLGEVGPRACLPGFPAPVRQGGPGRFALSLPRPGVVPGYSPAGKRRGAGQAVAVPVRVSGVLLSKRGGLCRGPSPSCFLQS